MTNWRQHVRRAQRGVRTLDSRIRRHRSDRASRARIQTDRKRIIEAGLFDEAYYREELPYPLEQSVDAVEHYIISGFKTGANPHPLVEGDWYSEKQRLPKTTNPLLHFLNVGAKQGNSTHPLLSADWYLAVEPESKAHPGGLLGHYLAGGWQRHPLPHPLLEGTSASSGELPLLQTAIHVGQLTREWRRQRHFKRQFSTFDYASSRAWKHQVRSEAAKSSTGINPLVSVILPTWNRAKPVRRAIKSVLRQTYANWQLIIVDDGSSDGTESKIADLLTDERIAYIRRETSGGVSVARNAGLELATGSYIAYLDSDNTWKSDFLELMVAHTVTTGARVSYCASQLKSETTSRVAYRGQPFNAVALRYGNYIDCICLLHEKALLDEVGAFDESLQRLVDWDLLLRLSSVTPFSYAPFVGTSYDVWAEDPNRITRRVPIATEYRLRAKHTLSVIPSTEPVAGMVSIIIPAFNEGSMTADAIESVLRTTDELVEILLVDNGSGTESAASFAALATAHSRVRHIRLDVNCMFATACNVGAKAARGEYLVFLNNDTLVQPFWLERLLDPIRRGEALAAQPLLLYPDGTVQCAGTEFNRFGMPFHVLMGFPGDSPEIRSATREALTAACLAVRRDDFLALDGFDPHYVNGFEDVDFCLRLQRDRQGPLQFVADSVVVHLESKSKGRGRYTQHNRRTFEQRWSGQTNNRGTSVLADLGLEVDHYLEPSRGKQAHPVHSPIVTRPRPRQRRWAIKIGPKDVMSRESWGDYHFAQGLKASLEALHQQVVVDCREAWYRDTRNLDDVTLTLRGVLPFKPDPATVNLLWLISHPREVRRDELRRFDRMFVASTQFANRLQEQGLRAEPLLQATDARRFRWADSVRPTALQDVLFVGNSRRVRRPIVEQAIAEEAPLRVFGANWEGLIPDSFVHDTYIPNEQLEQFYRSAGCVLNDHWEDMRRYGFISNRLFDLVACGARVVSDSVDGIDDVFGRAVIQLQEGESLEAALKRADAVPSDLRRARSKYVLEHHSFDQRARTLLDAVEACEAQLQKGAGA